MKPLRIGSLVVHPDPAGAPLLIAGPCVLEESDFIVRIASSLADIARRLAIPFVFKSSFDKANRSSLRSPRGPGIDDGLEILARVRREVGVPVLTDVHESSQCAAVGEVVDVLQIPAFLCRQTDLLLAAGQTGKAVNVKKGQFVAPADMRHPLEKVRCTGNENVLLTERGTFFGYGRLVVDMAGLIALRELGAPVVFDATHSVQQPGAAGDRTGGDRRLVPPLARAACAVGVDGLFFEVHPEPDRAPSDGPNMVRLDEFEALLHSVLRQRAALRA